MQYYHGTYCLSHPFFYQLNLRIVTGISPSTSQPFSPPVAFMRTANPSQLKAGFKAKQERTHIEQGKCHKCNKWVAVEGVKDVEVKVRLPSGSSKVYQLIFSIYRSRNFSGTCSRAVVGCP